MTLRVSKGYCLFVARKTGGELQHFLAAVNCMHTHLPELARVNAPLRDLLETLLQSRRTKRTATAKKDHARGVDH